MNVMKDIQKFNNMSAQAKQSKDAEWHSQEFWDVSNWLWEGLDPDDELLIAYRRRPGPEMTSMCALCYRWFKTREDFQLHMMTHIGTARFHECSVCHKKFLARFLKKRHESVHRYDSNFPFAAYWGGKNCEFPRDRIVYNHPMKRYKPAPYSPQYIKQLKKLERQCKKQPKICIVCEDRFQSVEELETHYDVNHATHKCVHCLEILENLNSYVDHLRSVHDVEIPTNSRGGRWRVLENMPKPAPQAIKPIILQQPRQDFKQKAPQIIHYVPLRILQTQAQPREKLIQPKPPEIKKENIVIATMPPPPPPASKKPESDEQPNVTSNDALSVQPASNTSDDSDVKVEIVSIEEAKGEENVDPKGEEDDANDDVKTEVEGEENSAEERMEVDDDDLPEEDCEELQQDSEEQAELDAEILEEDVEENEDGEQSAEPNHSNDYVVEEDMLEEETIPFVCHICGRTFSSQENVERHIRLHSQPGDRPFECKHCDKAFASHSNRKEHERIHTGERPYKCMYCERRFIQISNLKKHLQTHKDRSTFRCATCDKEFIKESSLVLHQRSHDTERKYRCKVCDRAYNYASLLKRHMRVHTGECPYRCPECKQPFHELVSLHYHRKKMHTGERPHKCSICERGFILSSDLKKHMRVHFKDQDMATAGASHTSTNGASRSSSNSSVATEIIPISEWSTAGNEITITTSNSTMQQNMDEDEILKHLNPQITLVVQSENRNGDVQDDDDDDDNRSVHYEIQNFDESFDVGSEDCVTYEAIELDTDGNGELRIVNVEDLESTTVQPLEGQISFVDENLQVTDVLL